MFVDEKAGGERLPRPVRPRYPPRAFIWGILPLVISGMLLTIAFGAEWTGQEVIRDGCLGAAKLLLIFPAVTLMALIVTWREIR